MASEFETTEPQKKSIVPWIILVIVLVILCCCCVFLVSAWTYGDYILQIINDFLQGGIYY
jgi:flagellar basal body-associated protein FliL